MSKHIQNIVLNKSSIWVEWIKEYKLKGKCLWDVWESNRDTWKMILQSRAHVRSNCVFKLGIYEHVSRREIKSAG